jgi:hypothetical protein
MVVVTSSLKATPFNESGRAQTRSRRAQDIPGVATVVYHSIVWQYLSNVGCALPNA